MNDIGPIGIVVLNYNGCRDTVRCIESLLQNGPSDQLLIVVDNASTDGTVSMLRDRWPELTIIESAENLGYSGGNNLGISYALKQGCDWVALLNNDVIVSSDALSRLAISASSDESIGVIGPMIYYPGCSLINFAGGFVDRSSCDVNVRSYREEDSGKYLEPEQVDYVSGACLLAKRQVFETIGPLDERYFLYWEETDFCFRAKRAGFKIVFEPRCFVEHNESATVKIGGQSMFLYYITRNKQLFAHDILRLRVGQRVSIAIRDLQASFRRLRKAETRKEGAVMLLSLAHAMCGRFGKGPTYL